MSITPASHQGWCHSCDLRVKKRSCKYCFVFSFLESLTTTVNTTLSILLCLIHIKDRRATALVCCNITCSNSYFCKRSVLVLLCFCMCACAVRTKTDREKKTWVHGLFQNRRKGKEKQAKREVRRAPVRKDERRGARNFSPKVIFKPRTGTLLLTSQTLKHRSV